MTIQEKCKFIDAKGRRHETMIIVLESIILYGKRSEQVVRVSLLPRLLKGLSFYSIWLC